MEIRGVLSYIYRILSLNGYIGLDCEESYQSYCTQKVLLIYYFAEIYSRRFYHKSLCPDIRFKYKNNKFYLNKDIDIENIQNNLDKILDFDKQELLSCIKEYLLGKNDNFKLLDINTYITNDIEEFDIPDYFLDINASLIRFYASEDKILSKVH